MYFAGVSPYAKNFPYVAQSSAYYDATINFKFDYQYSYNNYQASMIDAMTNLSTVLVFFFLI